MSQDPVTGIRILDETVQYADHAESKVLAILENASDRTAGSDELAEAITDWPSRYHFSPLRGGISRPLELRPEHRVLEIGCGTGAVTRSLAESGASVVGLEGSLDRARAAHVRCEDLDNTEIICGSLQAFTDDDGFDVVVVIGVLEYSASFIEGDDPFAEFLARARSFCRPDGALVLAIENQLGLKYLLGWPEDHLGTAWTSVEGYPDKSFVETFSRRQLGGMLNDTGFPLQKWYYPFPDYKLPKVIISHSVYEMATAADLVDQLVRSPVTNSSAEGVIRSEPRFSHRQFLEAGIGPDVANSFLVIAGSHDSKLDDVAPPENIGWILGGERLRSWTRAQRIVSKDGDLRVLSAPLAGDTVMQRQRSWLTQSPNRDDRFYVGETCEQRILEAVRGLRWEEFLDEIRRWWSAVEAVTRVKAKVSARPQHPFDDSEAELQLPDNWLDIHPSNFVIDGADPIYIDSEWSARGGVDPTIAGLRALWYLATELVTSGMPLPWPEQSTANEILETLAENLGLEFDQSSLAKLMNAEAELQSLVSGKPTDSVKASLEWLGSRSRISPEIRKSLPFTALDRRIRQLTDETLRIEKERQELESSNSEMLETCRRLEQQLSLQRCEFDTLSRGLEKDEGVRNDLTKALESLDEARRELKTATETSQVASERAETAERKVRELSARTRVAERRHAEAESRADQAMRQAETADQARGEFEQRAVRAEAVAETARQEALRALEQRNRDRRRAIRRIDEAHRQAAASAHQAEAARRDFEGLRRRLDDRLESLRRTAAADLERQHLASEEHLTEAGRQIEILSRKVETLEQEILMWRAWRESFDNRRLVRWLRTVQGLLGR